MSNRVIVTDNDERVLYNYIKTRISRLHRIMCKQGGTWTARHRGHQDASLELLIDDITDCEHRIFRLKDPELRREGLRDVMDLRACLYELAEDTWTTIVLS